MTQSYEQVLEARAGAPLDGGPRAPEAVVARFGAFFADFTAPEVERLLPETYTEDVWFDDTLKTIEGRESLLPYLLHSANNCDACTVQILDHSVSASGRELYVRWSMSITFKRFRKGRPQHSIGMTHLRIDEQGLICMHQDYWDATRGFFEVVPLLGWGIRKIKGRL